MSQTGSEQISVAIYLLVNFHLVAKGQGHISCEWSRLYEAGEECGRLHCEDHRKEARGG